MTAQLSERHPVDRLAEEFVARYRRGERPSISEYTEKYPELADKLNDILTALVIIEGHAAAHAPLDESSSASRAAAPMPQQLGEYSILRELGRGGMGVVYEAVQQSLGRHVALKVLPSYALIDPLRLKRFQHEAQAAARLHHSNIVPVFGVGVETGVHFYAMQYIQGRGLDDVLDELRQLKQSPETRKQAPLTSGQVSGVRKQGLGAEESLVGTVVNISTLSDSPRYYHSVAQLCAQVAGALEYAHHQGILHRDIKPSNLLLDAEGTIWVTDFGLARCPGQEELTHTGDLVGTLRYAAPERLHGEGDARADVYSLGLTLYELLTLRPAFESADRVTLVRQIAHEEPPLPRRVDPRIPRDLETIVLKAIAKEPGQRYAAAGEMANDLRRFLGDQPIEARRSSSWERGWRWCRRNPGIAAATGTAVISLVVGLAVSLWQWQRAEINYRSAQASAQAAKASAAEAAAHAAQADQDFQRALDAIDQMLTQVGITQLYDVPHMDQTRRAILEDALRFYEQMLKNPRSGQQARAAVAQAHFRLGMIAYHLGESSQSLQHCDKALALVQNFLQADGKNAEHRNLLANVRYFRGSVWANSENQLSLAEADFREALRIWQSLSAEFPQRPQFTQGQAHALFGLGSMLTKYSGIREAEPLLRESIKLAEGLLPLDSKKGEASVLLGRGLQNLAVLCETSQRLAEAEQLSRRSLELHQRVAAASPDLSSRMYLAQNLATLARIQMRRGAPPEGDTEQLFIQALKLDRQLIEDHPDIPAFWHQLATTAHNYGIRLEQGARRNEAEKAFREAIEAWETVLQKRPETAEYLSWLGGALNNLAVVQRDRGDLTDAKSTLEQAINRQQAALNRSLRLTIALNNLEKHYWLECRILAELGDTPGLDEAIGRQLKFLTQLEERDSRFRPLQVLLAKTYGAIGLQQNDARRLAEAEESLRTAISIWKKLVTDDETVPKEFSEFGAALNNLALVMAQQRRWSEMIPVLAEAVRHQTTALQSAPRNSTFQQFLHNHFKLLAQAHLALSQHRSVGELATRARESCPDAVQEYLWAVWLAACVSQVKNDAGLAADEREELVEQYAAKAISLLKAAQLKNSKDLRKLGEQPEFKPLRERPDFQSLLAEANQSAN